MDYFDRREKIVADWHEKVDELKSLIERVDVRFAYYTPDCLENERSKLFTQLAGVNAHYRQQLAELERQEQVTQEPRKELMSFKAIGRLIEDL